MKWVVNILLIIAVVLVLAVVFRNPLVRAGVIFGVKQTTGLDIAIGELDIDLRGTSIAIKNLHVKNPEGFPDEVMIDVPEVFVDYQFGPLLRGDVHLNQVRLHLRELLAVRNREGRLNLQVVQERLQAKETKGRAEEPRDAPPAAPEPEKEGDLKIDILRLQIGSASYKDYTVGTDPLVQNFRLNIDETFRDITDPKTIIRIIISKALRNSALARLTNMNPQEFIQQNILDNLTVTSKIATQIGDRAVGTVERTVTGTAQAAREQVQALTGALQDTVRLPFGRGQSQTQEEEQE